MPDWPLIAVRFALYLVLGLAFGWPLFCLYAPCAADRRPASLLPLALPITLFGVLGLVLSGLGFMLVLASMGGTGIQGIDPELFRVMLRETALGWAFLARVASLLLVLAAGLIVRRARLTGLTLAAGAGAIALASLAWNGHAGATEGSLATLHLGADILHLWAAGLWIAALFALLAMLIRRNPRPEELSAAHRALHGFSTIGMLTVATLVATGLVNTAMLVGSAPISDAVAGAWGQLLLLKLLLFGAMLILAAANRFRLTPRFEQAIAGSDTAGAAAALRVSLGLETAAALAILALVGWLGTLATPASGT